MKLVLFRRSNFHWASHDQDRFEDAVCEYSVGIAPRYLDGLVRWEKTFSMTFFEFRARLAELTLKNWARLDVDLILMFSDVTDIPQKPNHLIIPVDDDDWFSPRLTEVLRSGGMVAAARWSSIEMGSTASPYKLHYSKMIPTNGYASSWETLEPLTDVEKKVALMWHASADENLRFPKWSNIEDHLSMSIKWPSSSESLKSGDPLLPIAESLYHRLTLAIEDELCTEFCGSLYDAQDLLRDLVSSRISS